MPRTKRLSHEALRDFFYGIHTMFKAGYPISDCVSLLAEEEPDRRSRELFCSIAKELEDGIAFSDALLKAGAFPRHTVSLLVLEVIASIALIIVVLLQSGKESGLGQSISGNSDSYMSKHKNAGLDKMLAAATKWVALVWIVITLLLGLVK